MQSHPITDGFEDISHPRRTGSSRNGALQEVVGAITNMLPTLDPIIEDFDHTFSWAL